MMLVLEYFFISFDYLLFVVSKKPWARASDAGASLRQLLSINLC